jgi:hypothetical protein
MKKLAAARKQLQDCLADISTYMVLVTASAVELVETELIWFDSREIRVKVAADKLMLNIVSRH